MVYIMIRKQFYLIQRGKIREDPSSKTEFLSGRSQSLIDPDYMGAAEFEFGAIPASYIRIRSKGFNYILFDTGYYTVTGKKFYIYCDKNHYEEILEEIKRMVNSKDYYLLKEYAHMKEHFQWFSYKDSEWKKRDHNYAIENTDFWWCIDRNEEEYNIGDWFAFVTSDKEFVDKFCEIMKKDIEAFENMTEEEKEEKIRKANNSMYR